MVPVKCSPYRQRVLEVVEAIEDMGFEVFSRYGDARQTKRALLPCRPSASNRARGS
jgi:hypothetical protein